MQSIKTTVNMTISIMAHELVEGGEEPDQAVQQLRTKVVNAVQEAFTTRNMPDLASDYSGSVYPVSIVVAPPADVALEMATQTSWN